jgi:hypothetical protein
MPLPSVLKHGALRCHAKSKSTQAQCGNPAAFGMSVCRYHGARKTVLNGKAHPNYRHGEQTLAAKAARSAGLAELRMLEGMMHDLKMTSAKRMVGRKPKIAIL